MSKIHKENCVYSHDMNCNFCSAICKNRLNEYRLIKQNASFNYHKIDSMKLKYRIKDWIRNIEWWIQKKIRGYSDVEIWNLDDTISKWLVPRLKEFRRITQGYPGELESFEQWQQMLDEMIFGFEFKDTDWYQENVFKLGESEKSIKLKEFKSLIERAEKGRVLFAKYFNGIWW